MPCSAASGDRPEEDASMRILPACPFFVAATSQSPGLPETLATAYMGRGSSRVVSRDFMLDRVCIQTKK